MRNYKVTKWVRYTCDILALLILFYAESRGIIGLDQIIMGALLLGIWMKLDGIRAICDLAEDIVNGATIMVCEEEIEGSEEEDNDTN